MHVFNFTSNRILVKSTKDNFLNPENQKEFPYFNNQNSQFANIKILRDEEGPTKIINLVKAKKKSKPPRVIMKEVQPQMPYMCQYKNKEGTININSLYKTFLKQSFFDSTENYPKNVPLRRPDSNQKLIENLKLYSQSMIKFNQQVPLSCPKPFLSKLKLQLKNNSKNQKQLQIPPFKNKSRANRNEVKNSLDNIIEEMKKQNIFFDVDIMNQKYKRNPHKLFISYKNFYL